MSDEGCLYDDDDVTAHFIFKSTPARHTFRCARWEPHTLERALAPGRSGLSAEINTTRVNTPRTPTGYKVK